MQENVKVASEAGFWLKVSEKVPSRPVDAPVLVPESITAAPITGSPFSSFTVPLRVTLWALAIVGKRMIAAKSAQEAINLLIEDIR